MSKIISNDLLNQLYDILKSSRDIINAMSNVAELLHSGKFSDVKLVVGGKEFNVHKNILSVRSRVFSAMFESNMQEKNNNLVKITDIDPEVMQYVLQFVYAGCVDITEKLLLDILYAADKYEINGLKRYCEEKLSETISIENVGEMLMTVDRFNTEKLKQQLFEFITDNSKDIVETEAFNSALKLLSGSMLADCLKCIMKRG